MESDVEFDQVEFAVTFQQFMEAMLASSQLGRDKLSPLGQRVHDFLGVDLNSVDPVTEAFPPHQVVDVDRAVSQLNGEHSGQVVGISGPHRMHVDSFMEFLSRSMFSFEVGPVSYTRIGTGPASDRRVVSFGVSLLTIDATPLAVLQRAASPQTGREAYTVEVLCGDPAVADAYLRRVRELMATDSVLRGQVISFQRNDYEMHDPGKALRFLDRPQVRADQVILPDGVLERVTRHVVGIGQWQQALVSKEQHLKRGVLLYGPPGTGKTHLVRHLLSETPGTTAVLLSGKTLGLLNEATKLARANQPAIVVLEDCDLVAEERGGDVNAALFETLEALDGLDGDADITFILTTNRPDLLERALVERPGRVDLAVRIAKPDEGARHQLIRLYAGQLPFGPEVLQETARRTDGATASFAKELIRRAVLNAAESGREPTDDDLRRALDEMTSEAETFTRTLLGGGAFIPATEPWGPDEDA